MQNGSAAGFEPESTAFVACTLTSRLPARHNLILLKRNLFAMIHNQKKEKTK